MNAEEKKHIEKLVEKAQNGNKESFEDLFNIYFERLYRYISFRVDAENCEDLVSDVFLKIIQNLDRYRASVSFSSWVYRIAQNTIIDYYRKKKEVLISKDEDADFWNHIPDESNLTPDVLASKDSEYKDLHDSLKKLNPVHREILELRFLEGFSNKEVAHILDLEEGNIRILQMRALREIRRFLGKNED